MPPKDAARDAQAIVHSVHEEVLVAARPGPRTATFDCGHGRRLTVVVPRSGSVAFVELNDPDRTHDTLSWRDSPKIELTVEDPVLVRVCRMVVVGEMPPTEIHPLLVMRCPTVSESEWRRSLLRDFCSVAVPVDPARSLAEAVGA